MNAHHTGYLIIPGWQGSPEGHWQSHWHKILPNTQRVEQDNWQQPEQQAWVARLNESLHKSPVPVVLVAHSLGCITVARWAAQADNRLLAKVRGALLVTPADVERQHCPQPLRNFAPIAQQALPFASLVIGSTNDPAATAERVSVLAQQWGSQQVILPNVGHINMASGHSQWEQGLAWLYQLQLLIEQREQRSA